MPKILTSLIIIFSVLVYILPTSTSSQTIPNLNNNILNYELDTNPKSIQLNLPTPEQWKVNPRTDKEQIIIKKSDSNYLTIKLSKYDNSPVSNICYDKMVPADIDNRFVRRSSIDNNDTPNTQEYLFKPSNDKLIKSAITNKVVVTEAIISLIEQANGYSFNRVINEELTNYIPKVGEVFDLCIGVNDQGPTNVYQDVIYSIKSLSDNPIDQASIDLIIKRSLLGNSIKPDSANKATPLNAIENTVKSQQRSNIYIFLGFLGLIGMFSIVLVYMTRLKIDKDTKTKQRSNKDQP
jgi:hypothetical protein